LLAAPNETSAIGDSGGPKLVRIQREPGFSTEQLLSRIVQRPA
jgi:hypothetical protein